MKRSTSLVFVLTLFGMNPLAVLGHEGEHHHDEGAVDPGLAAGKAGPNYLYPDLVPFVEENEPYLQNWDISGGDIRLETVYANFGDGLFEIRSGDNIGGGQIEVKQRVYIDDDFGANYTDFVIDAAVSDHASHGHIHFEDFSRFSLHEMTVVDGILGIGDEVASSLKTSFSLSANRGPLLPEYIDAPRYGSSNNGIQQRISVGYGDRYSRVTEGQFFSIAGLPTNQLYWLRQHVDPDDNVIETDETNNMFEILIDLTNESEALIKIDGTFVQPGDPESAIPGPLGDLNGDGTVNGDDWTLYVAGLGAPEPGATDLNGDGVNNHADFLIFRQQFDKFISSSLQDSSSRGVPEPATIAMLTLAGLVLSSRRSSNRRSARFPR